MTDPRAGPACPLCSGRDASPAFEKDGHRFLECRGCRTLFLAEVPAPSRLADLYRDGSQERGSSLCWEVEARHDVASFARVLDRAARDGGPVLDVGCGSGPFLSFARGRGWQDLTGLELSPAAAAAARASSGARVLEEGLEEADLPQGHFAVVAFWDVLEHLPEPRRALQRAAALLRPGGLVAVSTPNRFGVAASVFGHRSVVVCPPEHLLLASRGGLRSALVDAGLEVDGIWSEDLRIREWTRVLGGGSAEGTEGEDRERYRRAQAGLTGASWFETARSAANVVLRATRLGDQLLAIAARPAAGKAGRP